MTLAAQQHPVFLRAAWRHLVMLNYACDPDVLAARVPRGTSLDFFEGTCFVSLVGFLFLDTRVMGLPVPFHRNFEEVNLRFYVRRQCPGEVRRGVVFVRELVPRSAIAWVAKAIYNEPYVAVPMAHEVAPANGRYAYTWKYRGEAYGLSGEREVPLAPTPEGSEAEFITEHYWGYTRLRDAGTAEYEVEHPKWQTAPLARATFAGDAAQLYGGAFTEILSGVPQSAFVADGSEILVRRGARIA